MTRHFPGIHDATIRHLFQCKFSDEQIGERLNMTPYAVRRHRERLNLGNPSKEVIAASLPQSLNRSADPNNPMVVAFSVLGSRLKEVNGAYRIDGTPTRFFDLMRETNRALVKLGRDQIGPSEWRVP